MTEKILGILISLRKTILLQDDVIETQKQIMFNQERIIELLAKKLKEQEK